MIVNCWFHLSFITHTYRGDHDGEYTLSTVRYQSEGEEDETVILENPTDDSKV